MYMQGIDVVHATRGRTRVVKLESGRCVILICVEAEADLPCNASDISNKAHA